MHDRIAIVPALSGDINKKTPLLFIDQI